MPDDSADDFDQASAAPEIDSPNGALARGLRVLATINDLNGATVAGLVKDTGLAKPTVIRLLQTLAREGYVEHLPDSQTYAVTAKVLDLSRARKGEDEQTQLIQAELDDLSARVKWPVEFLLADALSMRIDCNNREKAPIKLQLFERTRFPIHQTAAGWAALAVMDKQTYAEIADRLAKTPADRLALDGQVQAVRNSGFGWRKLPELSEGMAVAAVAVAGGENGPFGAISMIYFADIVDQRRVELELVPQLRETATRIGRILSVRR